MLRWPCLEREVIKRLAARSHAVRPGRRPGLLVGWAARKSTGGNARHVDRFPPIPESGTLYRMAGPQVVAAIVGQQRPDKALKSTQARATRVMAKSGYHKS
jgi:hypothetical protein